MIGSDIVGIGSNVVGIGSDVVRSSAPSPSFVEIREVGLVS